MLVTCFTSTLFCLKTIFVCIDIDEEHLNMSIIVKQPLKTDWYFDQDCRSIVSDLLIQTGILIRNVVVYRPLNTDWYFDQDFSVSV